MISSTCQQTTAPTMIPFESRFAHTVSRWVTDREQLRLLAPSSMFPLSAQRVSGWVKPGGHAFLLVSAVDGQPATDAVGSNLLGYGELNPMRGNDEHLWIGHVLIDPMRRRQGLGLALTNLLMEEAFTCSGATRISLVVFPENVAAIRCYEKAGFTCVREEHHRFGDSAERHHLYRFELLRCDYLDRTEPRPLGSDFSQPMHPPKQSLPDARVSVEVQ